MPERNDGGWHTFGCKILQNTGVECINPRCDQFCEALVLWMFYVTYFDTFSKYRYMYKWTFVSLQTKCEFKTCPELPSPHTKPIHGWLFKTINQTLHWNLYNRFNGLIGKIMIISKFSNKYLPQSQRIQVFFWFPRISEGAITLPLY